MDGAASARRLMLAHQTHTVPNRAEQQNACLYAAPEFNRNLSTLKLYHADHFVLRCLRGPPLSDGKYSRCARACATAACSPTTTCVPCRRQRRRDPARPRRRLPPAARRRRHAGRGRDPPYRLPWSAAMVERSLLRRRHAGRLPQRGARSGSAACAANLAGGTHHASRLRPGFCVFNDAAIAALAMRAEGRAGHIAIVDCDVPRATAPRPSSPTRPRSSPAACTVRRTSLPQTGERPRRRTARRHRRQGLPRRARCGARHRLHPRPPRSW